MIFFNLTVNNYPNNKPTEYGKYLVIIEVKNKNTGELSYQYLIRI